jgi:asparagine synthase (glutamine-hydrolysing)
VAADAALYYRGELRRALADAGVALAGAADDPAELIAAAYLAWGPECAARLEGDFAFVLWDAGRRRVMAARDFAGRRPLYYAEFAGALAVASSPRGVLAAPGCPRGLDLRALAATAAGFLGATDQTVHAAVRALPAGHTLVADLRGAAWVTPHWEPPLFESAAPRARADFDEAAVELRALLERAVLERLAPERVTAMWLSGGWDSPPLFATGRAALSARGDARELRPVSVSYPVGDPGREDETIVRIAERWQSEPAWVDAERVPLFGASPAEAAARAGGRDEPLAHVFELWNEALVGRSREVGARVALDGIGGDALFQTSPVFLADLLAGGRWRALRREWPHCRDPAAPWRSFLRWAVAPALPPAARAVAGAVRGRAVPHYRARPLPPWLAPAGRRDPELAALGVPPTARRPGESRAALESQWYLTAGWGPAVLSVVSRLGLAGGLEVRSPYYDSRVVRFAAGRPRAERRSLGETKRLLRASARGLLPDAVLAPRRARTGSAGAYFARAMRRELPAIVAERLRSVALAELGVVDADALRAAIARFLARPTAAGPAGALFFTLQTELWLQARLGAPAPGATPASVRNPRLALDGPERRTPAGHLARHHPHE